MRVAIDGSPIRTEATGVGRYALGLLESAPSDVTYVVLANRRSTLRLVGASATGGLETRLARLRPTIAWLQLIAPVLIARARCPIAHFTTGRAPLASPVPYVLTVHDLTVLQQPELYRRREQALTAPWLRVSVPRAAAIVVHSQVTARDLGEYFGPRLGPCHVVGAAPAAVFLHPLSSHARESTRLRYSLPERYWIALGATSERKNPLGLVDAFASARTRCGAPAPHLVITGAGPLTGAIARRAQACGVSGAVHLTGHVSQDDLPAIVAGAELLACPSLHEGFGLPAAEAQAIGTPVLASRAGALPETCGDAAVYVKPGDIDSLTEGLIQLGSDPGLRSALSAEGRRHSAGRTLQRVAMQTAAVYRSVFERL